MKRIWVSSDSHFFHKNIILYSQRPYRNIEEMNQALVDNWNSVVGEDDTIYFLGDFCFCPVPQAKEIFSQLKGKTKILIRGNHEKSSATMKEIGFDEVYEKLFLSFRGKNFLLCHYPYQQFINPEKPRKYHKQYPVWSGEDALLRGHSHSLPEDTLKYIQVADRRIPMLDVGCDGNDYRPISLDFIYEKLFENF